jgi:glycosyltransferase involved in cell wall biosynthesis
MELLINNNVLKEGSYAPIKPLNKVQRTLKSMHIKRHENIFPQILFVTSYPPRECGIATYSQDLVHAIQNKYLPGFQLKVCALENGESSFHYPKEVIYVLDTNYGKGYIDLAHSINKNNHIECVLVQHEFGFFQREHQKDFLDFLTQLKVPSIVAFHTVLPKPDAALLYNVTAIGKATSKIIVMTNSAAKILIEDYGISKEHIEVIHHGTHLVQGENKEVLKQKYNLLGRKVLSTFGLLSSGKGIDLTLEALPSIIENNPDVVFLIIGKTHPSVVKSEGEIYRDKLRDLVIKLKLEEHVKFFNSYFALESLLELLQLTDVYLFTSKDPNQAVSGTFSYALSCGCPVVSTPIPHAIEVLSRNSGVIIDFNAPNQLSNAVNILLGSDELRKSYRASSIQKFASTAWENSAIAHGLLFKQILDQKNLEETTKSGKISIKSSGLNYRLPPLNFLHLSKMTTEFGILQFSEISQPNKSSGYTIDDNARALIVVCMNFERNQNETDLFSIKKYLDFICYCQQTAGAFLNYVNIDKHFTAQNNLVNLSDANGRAIWALGYLISNHSIIPEEYIKTAEARLDKCYQEIENMHSPRAMAFAIKGLFYANLKEKLGVRTYLIGVLGQRLFQMFKHESDFSWQWFESYLTYANSVLPEALLMAGLTTNKVEFKETAKYTLDFLISKVFHQDQIRVVSNKTWLHRGEVASKYGEQPLDVCYTILALDTFIKVYPLEQYQVLIKHSFNWFLGNNQLNQIVYNPSTGGCYDGLEEDHVNINQGAESLVCYLMARLTIEKHVKSVK